MKRIAHKSGRNINGIKAFKGPCIVQEVVKVLICISLNESNMNGVPSPKNIKGRIINKPIEKRGKNGKVKTA